MKAKFLTTLLVSAVPRGFATGLFVLFLACGSVAAAQGEGMSPASPNKQGGKSADEIAKELSNPAGSLASFNFNLQYQTFKGDLPGAGDQDSWSMIFQPTLPFPVGDQGRRVIFRPAVPVLFDQPVFDVSRDTFDNADLALGDITFDLVYAGTEMKDKKDGFL